MPYYIIGTLLVLWLAHGLYKHQRGKNKVISVDPSSCKGCGRCVKRCTHHALKMAKGENGAPVAVVYPGKCTACGDCLGKCKFSALKLTLKLKPAEKKK